MDHSAWKSANLPPSLPTPSPPHYSPHNVFHHQASPPPPPPPPPSAPLLPPPPSICHFDASWISSRDPIGIGWVFRSSPSLSVHTWGRGSLAPVTTPAEAELLAMYHTVQHLSRLGHTGTLILTDSKQNFDLLSNYTGIKYMTFDHHPSKFLLQHISRILCTFPSPQSPSSSQQGSGLASKVRPAILIQLSRLLGTVAFVSVIFVPQFYPSV